MSLPVCTEIFIIVSLFVGWQSRPTLWADNNRSILSLKTKVLFHKLALCIFSLTVSHVYKELSVAPPSLSNFMGNLVQARSIDVFDHSTMLCRREEVVSGRTGIPGSSDQSLVLFPNSGATVSAIPHCSNWQF